MELNSTRGRRDGGGAHTAGHPSLQAVLYASMACYSACMASMRCTAYTAYTAYMVDAVDSVVLDSFVVMSGCQGQQQVCASAVVDDKLMAS